MDKEIDITTTIIITTTTITTITKIVDTEEALFVTKIGKKSFRNLSLADPSKHKPH